MCMPIKFCRRFEMRLFAHIYFVGVCVMQLIWVIVWHWSYFVWIYSQNLIRNNNNLSARKIVK